MLKSDDQKSPLLESTFSEPKQDPNHIMISPKFTPTVDMIELISKKSPDDRILARAPNAFIIYRKAYVAKEALRVRNKMYPKSRRRKRKDRWNIISFDPPILPLNKNERKFSELSDLNTIFTQEPTLLNNINDPNLQILNSSHNGDTNQIVIQKKLTPEKTLLELTESIEQKLKELGVKMFDYVLFKELKYVGRGGYAIVYSAEYCGQQYALKSLGNTLRLENKEAMSFIHELKILRELSHPNIINFYGVSKDPHTHNLVLILQLANGGTLRNYLESKWKDDNFEIPWNELINIAVEITCGLRYLHEKKICHRDLHSNNILINDGKILISDFGISKKMDSTTATSSVKGLPAYVEPRCYLYPDEKIKRDEKSDIYSLGVVFWELTSGTPPFSDSSKHAIIIKISQEKREKIIPGTPIDYAKLYMRCWDSEPEKRPTSEEILTELERKNLKNV
ncbi:kinase-like domain-containing protein [Gigaspora rosea]|uniref:Kinase-like domain-containing protein n=1 Tax=Gigaspora rosea TaxID=44941 RepID=A0A397VV19_9GLOM|nr:kinase-like domain-containing protein [Gigaspora rosea]